MEDIDDKSTPPSLNESPLLVYTHGDVEAKKIQTFCTISPLPPNNKFYIKSIPQLQGRSIMASFHDWLILRDSNDKQIFSLWNIVTSQQIRLPKLNALENEDDDNEDLQISACVLTCSPNDENKNNGKCAVLLFYKDVVFTCQIKGDKALKWAEQSIQLEGESVEVDTVIACDGVLYGLAQTDENGRVLITIEFARNDSNFLVFRSLNLKVPEFGLCFHSSKCLNYIVESCQKIYTVAIRILHSESMHISKVKVWELDLTQMGWVEVECLGNHAFLLGLHSSTWCWGSTEPKSLEGVGGVEGNCVYFVLEDDETLYSYRLKDNSFTFFLTCLNLQTPFYGPVWIMPQHLRLSPKEVQHKTITYTEGVDMLNQRTNMIKHEEVQGHSNDNHCKSLNSLASDIISLISKNLHFFDYLNFRASCKAFQSAVPPAQTWSSNSFPLFMLSKDDHGLCELIDITRNNSHSIVIPHSPSTPTSIEFSKNGWLVVCTGSDSLQFFNLFTRVKGQFPPSDYTHMFASIGFSTSPTDADCLTVGIIDGWEYVIISYFQSSDDKWNHHEFVHQDVEFTPSRCSPVYQNGAFYFLDQRGYLGVFELVEGEVNWNVYDKPETWDDEDDYDSCHLVQCNNRLISVFFAKRGKSVQLFRFNHPNKNWVELKSLEDYILFIAPSSSFSTFTKEGGMGNRIYLPRLKGDEIVFYSLETGKYHSVSDSTDGMEDLYGMTGYSLCCWV